MKSDWLKKRLLGKKYVGIEHFSANGQEKMAILEVVLKKDELAIEKEDNRNFNEQTISSLNKKDAYFLTINSSQVIQKEVSETDNNDNKLLQKHFPNVNFKEFYYQIWRLNSKSIIAICRKSHVEDILSLYHKNKIAVVNISLGNSNLQQIQKYFSEDKIITNSHTVVFNGNEPVLTKTDNPTSIVYQLNGIEIRSRQLLSFSGILGYLSGANTNSGETSLKNRELEDNFLQQQLFQKILYGSVYCLLFALLINFMVFNHYFKSNAVLDQKIEGANSSKLNTEQIKNRLAKKELSIKEYFFNVTAKKSGKIATITKSVPNTTLLTTLHFNPKNTKAEEVNTLSFEENTIRITGRANSTTDFTKWVEKMEKMNFISKVSILKFGKNEENETLFELDIRINETK